MCVYVCVCVRARARVCVRTYVRIYIPHTKYKISLETIVDPINKLIIREIQNLL